VSESCYAFDMGGSLGQSGENGTNVGSLLHGNDSELVFFVDPNEEALLVVVEDTSAFWPVPVEVAGIEETVALLKEEVIGDQLLLLSCSHGAKRVKSTGEFSSESITGLDNFLLNLVPLLPGDCGAEGEFSQVTADSDTC